MLGSSKMFYQENKKLVYVINYPNYTEKKLNPLYSALNRSCVGLKKGL